MQGSRSLVDGIRDWAQGQYAQMLERARRAQRKFSHSPTTWTGTGIFAGLLLLAAMNFRTLMRWARQRRLTNHPEEAPSQAAALWYQRMLRWLGRKGWRKDAIETPKEFLTRIEDPAMRQRVEDFTRAYEAARFGESSEEARRLPALYEEITSVPPDRER